MRKRTQALALALAAGLMVMLAVPAAAITFGQRDTTNQYANVGSIVAEFGEFGWFQVCTGTLIGDGVFLTAAHCIDGIEVWADDFLVTFEPTIPNDEGVIDPSLGTFYSALSIHLHPDWNRFRGKRGASDPADIGVILLDGSPSVEHAQLPPLGLLDMMHRDRTLRSSVFTAVGYGSVRESMTRGFQNIQFDNLHRNFAHQTVFSLTSAWLTLAMVNTPGLASGGTCYGDSGGPHFVTVGGETYVASITVIGDAPCVATDKTYRVDSQRSLSFLAQFLND